jgi:hypothetical protein
MGYFYPAHRLDANGISPGHSALAGSLKNNNLDKAWEWVETQYTKAMENGKTLLLSSESFFSESKNLFPILHDFTDNIQIVGYSRFPAEFVASEYSQRIKSAFETQNVASFCEAVLHRSDFDLFSGRYFWDWMDVAGEHNVKFKLYDRGNFYKKNIIFDFLRVIGLPENLINHFSKQEYVVNAGYVASVENFKIILNRFLDPVANTENRKLDENLQRFSDSSGALRWSAKERMGADIYHQLVQYFSESFEDLMQGVLEGCDRGLLMALGDLEGVASEPKLSHGCSMGDICEKVILPEPDLVAYLIRCMQQHNELMQQVDSKEALAPLERAAGY